MTTAFFPGAARSKSARVSSRLRKTKTSFFFTPSIGGISGVLPVAIRSLSKGVTLPSSPVTVLRTESTSVIRTPRRN